MPGTFRYFLPLKDDEAEIDSPNLTHEVGPSEQEYLRNTIIPRLQPLREDEYENGPHAILNTPAHASYILSAPHVYWCIEWKPGLLVIRFSPEGDMHWCALRSPNPEFGGRTATEAEIDAFDEDAPNPQYDLVFDAWDPYIDRDRRKGWSPASPDELQTWESALARANAISARIADLSEDDWKAWLQRCRSSPIWSGAVAHG